MTDTGGPKRVAVVLFNLGGPYDADAVRPFLFNLFNDPAIIRVPQPVRWCLATLISRRRTPLAREIYAYLGGGSPLMENTEAQAAALAQVLSARFERGAVFKVFIAMRYWHPMTDATVAGVKAFAPDEVVLLPLYPQFSTTTTASSLKAWREGARSIGLSVPTKAVCCYPTDPAFIGAHVDLIAPLLRAGAKVLFSAHGLPKKVIAAGDPYVWQVEQTARAVAASLREKGHTFDWMVCYQSRVGPLEWVGPSTDEVLEQAGRERAAIVLVPIAFVSEHSETLVELDVTYRELAEAVGVREFIRVPALGIADRYVESLANLVAGALSGEDSMSGQSTGFRCPEEFTGCAKGCVAERWKGER